MAFDDDTSAFCGGSSASLQIHYPPNAFPSKQSKKKSLAKHVKKWFQGDGSKSYLKSRRKAHRQKTRSDIMDSIQGALKEDDNVGLIAPRRGSLNRALTKGFSMKRLQSKKIIDSEENPYSPPAISLLQSQKLDGDQTVQNPAEEKQVAASVETTSRSPPRPRRKRSSSKSSKGSSSKTKSPGRSSGSSEKKKLRRHTKGTADLESHRSSNATRRKTKTDSNSPGRTKRKELRKERSELKQSSPREQDSRSPRPRRASSRRQLERVSSRRSTVSTSLNNDNPKLSQ